MTIQDRNLKPGTRLVARYHKQQYHCEVVERGGGKLGYRLEDGREFKSPSAAGMAITSHACDGWVFWSVEKTESAPTSDVQPTEAQKEPPAESIETKDAEEQKKTPIEAAPAAEEPTLAKKIFRTPNQKGTGSQTRWYCQECGKSFLADIGVLPKTCPAGHQGS